VQTLWDGVHQQEMVHTMKSQGKAGRGRRQHDRSFKTELIRQSLEPGASVSAIALQNGINANLLFKWRREERRMTRPAAEPTVLLPVCVRPSTQLGEATSTLMSAATSASRASRASVIELEIAGAQLRLRGGVDEAILASVLRALRQST
jgi:transposase